MREFVYRRGDKYNITVMVNPDGTMTYRDIKTPYKYGTQQYNDVVLKMITHAEKAIENIIKGELHEIQNKFRS